MSNIIWQQPNKSLAITSIFDGSDPEEYSQLLIKQGNIPTEWIPVSFNYTGTFPDTQQELWYFENGEIKTTDPVIIPELTPVQKLQFFLDQNPDVKELLL